MSAADGLKKFNAAPQTAGENTVKRSRPVEKYRQIYYTTYFHKNQGVFSIFHKNKKSPLTNRQR